MSVLGIPVSVFIVIAFASLFYQFWVHTQLIGKLGWFDRLFVSPSNHRVHHGQNDHCIDVNYGATLIIWDRLFATFSEEIDDQPVVYGIRKPLHSWNPIWANLHILSQIFKDFWASRGLFNRLMVVFGPPGWRAEAKSIVKTHFNSCRFKLFQTPISRGQRIYGLLSFAMLSFLYQHFLLVFNHIDAVDRCLLGGFVIVHALSLGAILQTKCWALAVDFVRGNGIFLAMINDFWLLPVSQVTALLAWIGLGLLNGSLLIIWRESRTGQ